MTDTTVFPPADPLAPAAARRDAAAVVTLSLVVPMFNEAENLDRLFAEIEESLAADGCTYERASIRCGICGPTPTWPPAVCRR